jgi:hypothetical protein
MYAAGHQEVEEGTSRAGREHGERLRHLDTHRTGSVGGGRTVHIGLWIRAWEFSAVDLCNVISICHGSLWSSARYSPLTFVVSLGVSLVRSSSTPGHSTSTVSGRSRGGAPGRPDVAGVGGSCEPAGYPSVGRDPR